MRKSEEEEEEYRTLRLFVYFDEGQIRNVLLCLSEQGPPHFRGPTHVCQKFYEVKVAC